MAPEANESALSKGRELAEDPLQKSASVKCHLVLRGKEALYTEDLPGIDGLVGMKLIFGIRSLGTRTKRESRST
jgi:hypothetical protein